MPKNRLQIVLNSQNYAYNAMPELIDVCLRDQNI